MRPLRWAFLVLEEHPYGRAMLRELLAAGFVPELVVEERSSVADVEREKFVVRMAGFAIAPAFDEQLRGVATARAHVASHNDSACAELLRALAPDVVVLGGTRILRGPVLAAAPIFLNAHPGLLPEVRGSASVAWAIELDERIGCTCHLVEAGIDTGPIVVRRELAVRRGDTYEKLCHATVELSAVLMREALERLRDRGALDAQPQGHGAPARKNMPDEQLAAVKRKLARGEYAHYAG